MPQYHYYIIRYVATNYRWKQLFKENIIETFFIQAEVKSWHTSIDSASILAPIRLFWTGRLLAREAITNSLLGAVLCAYARIISHLQNNGLIRCSAQQQRVLLLLPLSLLWRTSNSHIKVATAHSGIALPFSGYINSMCLLRARRGAPLTRSCCNTEEKRLLLCAGTTQSVTFTYIYDPEFRGEPGSQRHNPETSLTRYIDRPCFGAYLASLLRHHASEPLLDLMGQM